MYELVLYSNVRIHSATLYLIKLTHYILKKLGKHSLALAGLRQSNDNMCMFSMKVFYRFLQWREEL